MKYLTFTCNTIRHEDIFQQAYVPAWNYLKYMTVIKNIDIQALGFLKILKKGNNINIVVIIYFLSWSCI